jgi:hypothetical protein
VPRIPVPVSDPQRPEQIFTSASQGGAVGQALQGFGQDVRQLGGALQQRQSQREVSALNAEFAKAQAELTVEWNETLRTADPNDPDVAERFRSERVKSRLDAIGETAKSREGRDYFTRLSAGLGANFLVSTENGMAQLSEVAAVQSFETVKNQFGDALLADPMSLDQVNGLADMTLEGYVQRFGLSRENALKMQTELKQSNAETAAYGRIDRNPEEAKAFVQAGGYSEFLDGAKTAQLLRYADSVQEGRIAAEKRRRQEVADARAVELVNSVVRDDGSIDLDSVEATKARALRDARITGDTETAFKTFRFLDSLVDEGSGVAKLNSPVVQADLLRRAALPPGDPNRLTADEATGFIGRGVDFSFVKNQVVPTIQRAASPDGQNDNQRVDAHLGIVRSQLGLGEGPFSAFTNNPRAQQAFERYKTYFYGELAKRQDQGQSLSDILNEGSPTFIGSALQNFVPPPGADDLPPVATPGVTITLDPQYRRVTFGAATSSQKVRSPEELDKLLQGTE